MKTWKISNGDLLLTTKGRLDEIAGPQKVAQDLTHWLLNDLGYNKFHTWMGSELDDVIGQLELPTSTQAIRRMIVEALNTYTDMQIDDLQERIEERGDAMVAIALASPDSIIKKWVRLDVQGYAGSFLVNIVFETYANQTDAVTIALRNFSMPQDDVQALSELPGIDLE